MAGKKQLEVRKRFLHSLAPLLHFRCSAVLYCKAKKEQKAAADLERAQAKQAGPGYLGGLALFLREVPEDIKDTTAALEADGSLSTVVKDFP